MHPFGDINLIVDCMLYCMLYLPVMISFDSAHKNQALSLRQPLTQNFAASAFLTQFSRMLLHSPSVDPKCDYLSETSRMMAVGSTELLENAKVFPTLEACVLDLERVYATTARNR